MLQIEPQAARGHFLWLVWSTALALALLLTVLAAGYAWFPGDVRLARGIQDFDGGHLASYLGTAVYHLGRSPLLLVSGGAIAAAFLVCRHNLAALFVLISEGLSSFGSLLKELAERPRPVASVVEVNEQAAGFSFPSGHVLGSVLLWGFLFYLAAMTIPHRGLRLLVQTFCLLVPLLTGLQRVQAGAHWPSDVFGGFLWGLILLFLLIKAFNHFSLPDETPSR
jgi:membrane-associated phospholipid phosphatase